MEYRRSQDMTYNFSIVQLASIAELACSFLVLCIPSTPKALAALPSLPFLGSLVGFTKLSKSSKASSQPPYHITPPTPGRYQQDDDGFLLPLTHVRSGNDGFGRRNEHGVSSFTPHAAKSEFSAKGSTEHKEYQLQANKNAHHRQQPGTFYTG